MACGRNMSVASRNSVRCRRRDWTARVGRQTAFGAGVLGRFDGARVDWQWRPQIGLNLTLGRPVVNSAGGESDVRSWNVIRSL